ncbi:metallophosphoesterase [Motiliproteus sp. MSK22-1]|uniref:metallophosphoesterase family protein n=1 Tax=Motiliproteus sp. MSK22-1 TaxID=1897630 RepID=UPI00097587E3|nr:metallophosphoesterase family protein [Motiliproteus sp. MSK22-1]OMH31656.1 restriction endonuclease subunit S [Motiliproteus sp. MSK22-1]
MSIIAHISDLHFGREQMPVIQALLRSLREHSPDLVIISGDLTQRATHREYQQAKEFLDNLSYPYMVVPGNHDLSAHHIIERFMYPWRKWRRYISEQLESVVEKPEFVAVGVNSARRLGFYFDWSRGRINQTQVRQVLEKFKNTADPCLRIVVAHHPFWLPSASLRRHLIGGRDEALEAFSHAGVDLVLGGHIHLPFMKILNGVLVSHAGTTVSNRLITGQPNSFNMIYGNHISLQLETLEWDGDEFSLRQRQCFNKKAEGWAAGATQ